MAYRDVILGKSPQLYFEWASATATPTNAGSGNVSSITQSGVTTATPGVTGAGYTSIFNGTTSYIGATFTNQPFNDGTWTVEMWVKKTTASDAGYMELMNVSDANNEVVIFGSAGNQKVELWYRFGGAVRQKVIGPVINDTNWHHIVATSDGTNVRLYVDNVSVGTPGTAASGTYSTNLGFFIGAYGAGAGSENWNGRLDEIAVYPTGLSSVSITENYNTALGIVPNGGYTAQAMTGSGVAVDPAFFGPERFVTDLTTYTPAEWSLGAGVTASHAAGKLTITNSGALASAMWQKPTDVAGNASGLIRVKRTAGTGSVFVGWEAGAVENVPADGNWYWVRLTKSGSTTSAKIWENSQTEPAGNTSSGGNPANVRGLRFALDSDDTLVVDYMAVDVTGAAIALPTLPAENVSTPADAATGSGLITDAAVNIWAGYNPEPFTASGEMLNPPQSITYFHSPAFGSGEMGDASFAADANAIIYATAAGAEGNILNPAEASNAGDPYYVQLLATIDTDDFWYRLNEASGTVVVDAKADGTKDAILYGDYSFGQFGPETRRAIRFADGYFQRSGTLTDDSDTDTFAFEVVLRTTEKDGMLAYGLDRANPLVETGPVPTFRNSIYLKGGKVTTNWNYAGTLEGAFELSGTKDIADGQWHHVVVAFNNGPVNNLNSGLRIYIDGKLDMRRRRDIVPGLWASPDSYFGMPEAWRNLSALYPWQKNFKGDVMEVAFRYSDSLTHDEVIELNYAVFGIIPVRTTPAVGFGTMPEAKAKGNTQRALVLYTKWSGQGLFNRIGDERNSPSGYSQTAPDEFDHNIDIGRVYEPGASPWEELAGYRVEAVPIMREEGNVLAGPYRDPITDLPRLLDLQEDIDLDSFDLIVFRNWPDEGADREVFFSRGYTNDSIQDFLASVKQAVVDGMSLEVTNVGLAFDLGLITGAQAIDYLYDRNPDGTESDFRAAAIHPFSETDEGGENFYDVHANNWHRVTATVPYLTDIALAEKIKDVYLKGNATGGADGNLSVTWGFKASEGAYQIGEEVMSPAVLFNRLYVLNSDPTVGQVVWDRKFWAITPNGLPSGTPVYKLAQNIYRENALVPNPYAEYIGAAILQPGDSWGSSRIAGKVFINVAENPYLAADMTTLLRQIVPPNNELENARDHETPEQREWDYSYSRVQFVATGDAFGNSKMKKVYTGEGSGSGQSESQGSFYVTEPGRGIVGIEIIEKYETEPVVLLSWALRGLLWLGIKESVPAGSKVIRPTAITASGVMPEPQVVAQKSVTVATTAAQAVGVLVAPDEANEPDATVYAFAATASGTMSGAGRTITVGPLLGSGELVDNFSLISASGEQVTLYLHATEEIKLYLMEDK